MVNQYQILMGNRQKKKGTQPCNDTSSEQDIYQRFKIDVMTIEG